MTLGQHLFKPLLQMNALRMYCLQMAIVLFGTTFGLRWLHLDGLIVPVTLGAIATALTDFDDRLSLRIRNLVYVILLFFAVSSLLECLYPYPLYFALWLAGSSCAFILCGALGQRYATISFGTILLSIYTMFGLGEYPTWHTQPSYFVLGAAWYGLISILFFILRPTLAVQENLSTSLQHMADLLLCKAQLFDPDQTNIEGLLYELSLKNTQVIQSFNQTKSSLLTRLKASRANADGIFWLNVYFLAQDIHEQATANYLHYEQLHQHFSRSDLVFRIQKNLRLQALACQQLAASIYNDEPYELPVGSQHALDELTASMQDWIEQHPHNSEVKNLQFILNNLTQVHNQLQQLHANPRMSKRYHEYHDDLSLFDDDLRDCRDIWLKFKAHLHPQSALFRHAVRIGFVFLFGYGVSLLPFAQNGYWILLTSLFVCQMSYFATKSRLKLRTLGTILGVILGIPILYFVPSIEGQLFLTVCFGVGFFYLRAQKYAMATLMATLMVLLIFNLKGAGYTIILPRIIDTLLGCLIAWFAVHSIWPDWNFRQIPQTMQRASYASLNYFAAVIQQYQTGKDNRIEYRTARRLAHNAEIELSTVISSLSTEPQPNHVLVQLAFRYLVYSHSQLSYIAALGSHREHIEDESVMHFMHNCQQLLTEVLVEQQTFHLAECQQQLTEIEHFTQQNQLSTHLSLVLKQVSLILETLPELVKLKQGILDIERG
jgi:uncharacterized membrane protein (TIGR01666 family)